jgi:hypothetical protein
MNVWLVAAAVLAVGVGIAHSYLGERYILIRLFRRENLPNLFGSEWFTKRTLRFAWHLTTVAWWGFAALLWLQSGVRTGEPAVLGRNALLVIASTFLVSAVITFGASRGRHLAWIVFLAMAVATFLGAG